MNDTLKPFILQFGRPIPPRGGRTEKQRDQRGEHGTRFTRVAQETTDDE